MEETELTHDNPTELVDNSYLEIFRAQSLNLNLTP